MGSANDLVVLFLGLEILSIAFYVMAASHRRRIESQESGIKYFILGGFSSAFFLYGIAMVYGTAGSTNFTTIVDSFNTNVPAVRHDAFILAGVGLLLVGLGFKVTAVPFHFWAPDVYQGAPTPVTSFMASVGKVAAFGGDVARADLRVAALARRLPPDRVGARRVDGGGRLGDGGRADQRQAHAGVLVDQPRRVHPDRCRGGLASSPADPDWATACPSALLYLLLYSVLVVGTFAVVTMVARTGDGATDLSSFRGLGKSHPVLSLAHDRAAAGPGRRAVDLRLRRQVRRDPGRGRGAQLRDRHHRDGRLGDRRLPVPADHDLDVGHRAGIRRRRSRTDSRPAVDRRRPDALGRLHPARSASTPPG